ncbi:katanin p60 ATPase-containing subunit A-like 1 [Bombus vosnesenskii]|uniref:Katanin p60 ATPase-containing subunit A-like 1 n=1 Tax=Bombus vosnesenskii TaxID=207650 RepID=A0A6J3LAS5_9HYME|nr:katanin p60 ATPase-containing subunit A-like 1 [Bombus vosnesenskii]XP_033362713.1 katanin p60 ATPase-containing subunit A-like 1 [Bombus vosnesenskii]
MVRFPPGKVFCCTAHLVQVRYSYSFHFCTCLQEIYKTGKPKLAKAVATECHCTFFNITASSLVSKWRGDSEKYIRVLFELAYSHSPTIIFIDEIDWIATNKGDCILSEPAKRFRSELLSRLDGLVSNENSNVVLLATTNSPWGIDAALPRRLEKQIYVS